MRGRDSCPVEDFPDPKSARQGGSKSHKETTQCHGELQRESEILLRKQSRVSARSRREFSEASRASFPVSRRSNDKKEGCIEL